MKTIEWNASRTGLINPIAVFDPVELEGTTVSRASVHNVSIVEELQLGIGDEIKVYKANMIIPQISANLTKSGKIDIPSKCPVCDGETEIRNENGVKTLYCKNPECTAKQIKLYTLFVTRNAMNIDGLSEETLEKFIDAGYIKEFADIYHLDRFKAEIVETPGFGEKSYEKIIESVENSRECELHALIFGLGIPQVGVANAKMICKALDYDLDKVRNASIEELIAIDGVGDVMATKFREYFDDKKHARELDNLLKEVKIKAHEQSNLEQNMEGLVFVVTGSVEKFENRDAVKAYIEARGGKVTNSVTSKTDYLINNDVNSTSSKNKKAKELGKEILTEEEFLAKFD